MYKGLNTQDLNVLDYACGTNIKSEYRIRDIPKKTAKKLINLGYLTTKLFPTKKGRKINKTAPVFTGVLLMESYNGVDVYWNADNYKWLVKKFGGFEHESDKEIIKFIKKNTIEYMTRKLVKNYKNAEKALVNNFNKMTKGEISNNNLIVELMDYFEKENQNFDRQKFLKGIR